MEHIFKSFAGVHALRGASLCLEKGSVHALVGENGAGKSTLMKILSGACQADAGGVFLEGKKVRVSDTRTAIQLGISMVYQELNAVPEMTIGENVFLGREPKTPLGTVDYKKIYDDTAELFREFDLPFKPREKMAALSVANTQMIEIIKAVSRQAKIIVMDEPTSSITDKEVEKLFTIIRQLKGQGVSIIYISHRMEELAQIADMVTVMRDGETVATERMCDVLKDDIVRLMVGREIGHYFPEKTAKIGKTVFEVKGLTREGTFEKISFSVREGEVLGVSGLMGAGRSEVMSAIFGLLPYDSGEVVLAGERLHIRRVWEAIKKGIVLVPEDRKNLGLVLGRSIRDNISLPHLNSYGKWCLRLKQERRDIAGQMERFRIKASHAEAAAGTLSGGNQQKVVLAKWLLRKPKLVILDEPTRGIDVGAKQEVYQYIRELETMGIAVIMVSSELPEILGMSDRVIVMSQGHITAELDMREATQEKIMSYAMEDVSHV